MGGGEELPGGSEDIFLASDVVETASGEYWLAGTTLDTLPDPGGELPEFRSRAWIASHKREDPRPPADFVTQRFGEYGSEFESFSVWPAVDWGATAGLIGLSWDGGARLLEDLSPGELERILANSSRVDAWVR